MTAEHKCPKCGFVMVEEFEYRKVNDLAELAIPTGRFSCLHCKAAAKRIGGAE